MARLVALMVLAAALAAPLRADLLFAAIDWQGGVHIVNYTRQTSTQVLNLPGNYNSMAEGPDGRLYTVRTDTALQRMFAIDLESATAELVGTFELEMRTVRGLAYDGSDGAFYLAAGDASVRRFDLQKYDPLTGALRYVSLLEDPVQGMDLLPDGTLLTARPEVTQSLVERYDPQTGTRLATLGPLDLDVSQAVVRLEDGRVFVAGGDIAEIDPVSGAVISSRSFDNGFTWIRGMALIPEPGGLLLASGGVLLLLRRPTG